MKWADVNSRYLKVQQDQILSLMTDAKEEIAKIVAGADLMDSDILKQSQRVVGSFFDDYAVIVKKTNIKLAKETVQDEADSINKMLSSSAFDGYEEIIGSIRTALKSNAGHFLLQLNKNFFTEQTFGKSFSDRLWLLKKGANMTIRNMATYASRIGMPATEFAQKVSQYLQPDARFPMVTPSRYYGAKFVMNPKTGEMEYKLAGKVYHPDAANIPRGSISYNAFRLARTEIGRTWRQASVEAHKGMMYTEGYKWVLSKRHSEEDICDTWAKKEKYTYAEITRLGHPNCLCHVEIVLMDEDTLLSMLQMMGGTQ